MMSLEKCGNSSQRLGKGALLFLSGRTLRRRSISGATWPAGPHVWSMHRLLKAKCVHVYVYIYGSNMAPTPCVGYCFSVWGCLFLGRGCMFSCRGCLFLCGACLFLCGRCLFLCRGCLFLCGCLLSSAGGACLCAGACSFL